MTVPSSPITILYVDADEVDAEFLFRKFQQHNLSYRIVHAASAAMALAILRGEDSYTPLPQSYIILLELALPGITGLEFLQEIRQDKALNRSIVLVLTTSDRSQDQIAAYTHNVAAYLLKDEIYQDFSILITLLKLYTPLELPR